MSSVCRSNSGVDWLYDIPSDWHITPTHAVTLATDTHDPRKEPENEFSYIDVSSICNAVHEITEYEILAGYEAPTRARKVVSEADTIFATVRPYLRNIAQIPMGLHAAICSTGYCVLRAEHTKVSPRYLFFSCVSAGFVASIVAHQQGANYPAVSDRVVRRQVIPLPPLNEQRAIASYLDRETAKIDALIAKTEQLNALLREKRVALISRAVTKGLDAAAPLKDSGVEWLGEIPAHWDVKRLKYLGRLKSGNGITSELINDTGPYPVFGGNGIRGYAEEYTHEGDYVLVGRQGALCGNVNYANGRFWASEHAVVVNQTGAECVKWLGEVLRSMNLNQYSMSAAQPGLSVERIENLQVPAPSVTETHALAEYLDHETAKIDALIAKNDQLIALLREKRTALISAAVTGKISVPSVSSVVK